MTINALKGHAVSFGFMCRQRIPLGVLMCITGKRQGRGSAVVLRVTANLASKGITGKSNTMHRTRRLQFCRNVRMAIQTTGRHRFLAPGWSMAGTTRQFRVTADATQRACPRLRVQWSRA